MDDNTKTADEDWWSPKPLPPGYVNHPPCALCGKPTPYCCVEEGSRLIHPDCISLIDTRCAMGDRVTRSEWCHGQPDRAEAGVVCWVEPERVGVWFGGSQWSGGGLHVMPHAHLDVLG